VVVDVLIVVLCDGGALLLLLPPPPPPPPPLRPSCVKNFHVSSGAKLGSPMCPPPCAIQVTG
jgi:hypothetical protein